MRYELTPEVFTYEVNGDFFLETAPNGNTFTIDNEIEKAIIKFIASSVGVTEQEICKEFGPLGHIFFKTLIDEQIVCLDSSPLGTSEKLKKIMGVSDVPAEWQDYIKFHIAIHDFPFFNMGGKGAMFADNNLMQEYRAQSESPELMQDLNTGKGMEMSFFEEIINSKLTTFGQLDKFSLNCILDFAFGIRRSSGGRDILVSNQNYWELPKIHKVVPSGGGRHPTEVFVAIKNLIGFGGGLLHFNTKMSQLQLVHDGTNISSYLGIDENEVYLILCPEYMRAMWRYRDPRSFRAVPIDVGHLLGAIEIMANYLGINVEQKCNFDSNQLCELIGECTETQIPIAILKLFSKGPL